MAINLMPIGNDAPFILPTGVAASGYKLFTYTAGSTTKQNTYTDNTGNTANANPIILNSSGYPASAGNVVEIFGTVGVSYKFVLATSTDTDPPASPLWTRDNIPVINDTSAVQNEWVGGAAPTFISATSFSLVGDQTATFTVGRRLQTTNTGGTVYSTILTSAFTTLTTVTVVNDSSSLDSGLSAVNYGVLQSVNKSAPPFNGLVALTSVAGTNTVTASATRAAQGYVTNQVYNLIPAATNTGATTLNLNSLGAKSIFRNGVACVGGELQQGMPAVLVYDGTQFHVVANSAIATLRSYIAGLGMSTAGGSTTMTVAVGQATDSTNAVTMTLAASTGKTTSGWAVGTGNGGLDTSSIANSTWYHFYAIMRPDTGVVDVVFSLSATAPTMPANYSFKRRIGAGKTDGSGNWTAFFQYGDFFEWSTPTAVSANNPGTGAVTRTMDVPINVTVDVLVNVGRTDTTPVNAQIYLSDLATADLAASSTAAPGATNSATVSGNSASQARIRTNTSGQIRSRITASDANVTLVIATLGWTDTRGKDA